MANRSRIDQIKNARSIGEVLDVVEDIAYEFKNSAAVVSRIISSLSAEIVMDVRQGSKKAPKAIETKFVAPKAAELKKHVDVLHKLYDNVVELDSAEAMMQQSFAGHKKLPAALQAVKALKQEIDNAINDALDALTAVAQKHIPTKMRNLADKVVEHLIESLPTNAYENIHYQIYVVPDPEHVGMFLFSYYIDLAKLKNLQGFVYDTYHIIVSARIEKTGLMHLFVNGLPEFKVPGKYPLGKEVSSNEAAIKQVDLILDHNNFVHEFEKLPMPLDTDRATHAGISNIKGIDSVRVENDELIAFISSTVKSLDAAKKIVPDLLARLNSIVGARRNDKTFQYKFVSRGGKKAIKVILTPNVGRKMHVSIERLREVSELMGLNEKQEAALRFALQH